MRCFLAVAALGLALSIEARRFHNPNSRQDVINDWIRTIRQSPQHHSLSPSWNGKSPYEVIGVSGLPLQNEAEKASSRVERQSRRPDRPHSPLGDLGRPLRLHKEVRRRPQLQQGPFRRNFRPDQFEADVQRNPQFNNQRKRRPGSAKIAYQNGQPRFPEGPQRLREERFPPEALLEESYPFEAPPPELPSRYPPIEGQEVESLESPSRDASLIPVESELTIGEEQEPKRPIRQQFPDFGPNPFIGEEHKEFPRKFFEQPPRPGGPNRGPQGRPPSRPLVQDLDINAGIPPRFDSHKKLTPTFKDHLLADGELQKGFKPYFKPSELLDEALEGRPEFESDNRPNFKNFENENSPLSDGPLVELGTRPLGPIGHSPFARPTPRPIPIPGPNDFPPPPPRPPQGPPPPPPTHPTLPPAITHPPEHYLLNDYDYPETDYSEVSDFETEQRRRERPTSRNQRPLSNQKDSFESNDHSNDDEEGFFQVPESFPSLASLGGGFESMKIRNKRSAQEDPLVAQERRFVPIRRAPQLHRQQRNQHRRQGDFGFQPGFWEEVESEFFNPETPVFGQRNQPFTRRTYNHPNTYSSFDSAARTSNGRYRDPYPQQSVRESLPFANDFTESSNFKLENRDNEILGSGNFEVIKGGTFYDADTYYNTRYNSRPQSSYGGNFLENFRDFADIKGDLYNRHPYN